MRPGKVASRSLVVVSFYDAYSSNNLIRLLTQLRTVPAGAPFDICVVVNRSSAMGKSQRLPDDVRILERKNDGMNIGAWDYGWRENPGFQDYLFLQDDCTVVREGWLAAFRECAHRAGVGLVGEYANRAWEKPWDVLRVEQAQVQMREHVLKGRPANRVDVYLDFLKRHNVAPGKTGGHMRSLVWFVRRDILEKIGGFLHGQNYGECIAAEIAATKMVEALGRRAEQVHREPFHYIAHQEWQRRAPGEPIQKVEPTSFAGELAAARDVLGQFVAREGTGNESIDALHQKLLKERGEGAGLVTVTLIVEPSTNHDALDQTLRAWRLQSYPRREYHVLGADPLNAGADNFLVFAKAGELLHPSLAFLVATLAGDPAVDVVVWNSIAVESEGRLANSRPDVQPLTLLNHDYVGRDFAVRASVAREYLSPPASFGEYIGLPLKRWLAWSRPERWRSEPTFLALRHRDAERRMTTTEGLPNVGLEVRDTPGYGKLVWPTRSAANLSVIIPFRDNAQLTLDAVRSVARQRTGASIELVLVDNQSQAEEREKINDAIARLNPGIRAQILDYPHPFNHSRQCNLGAQFSSGEVLIFMNNDTQLESEELLEGLARWALVDRVASAGCRLCRTDGSLGSAGMIVRRTFWPEQSPVEESRDERLMLKVREVSGNTFALAAVRRNIFFALGGLDELEFPRGYNDVDYCLRALEKGYTHVYVGPIKARHEPGTSRGKADEIREKRTINSRHPTAVLRGTREWRIEPVEEPVPLDSSLTSFIIRLMSLLKRLARWTPSTARLPRQGRGIDASPSELPLRGYEEGRVATPHVDHLTDDDLQLLNELLPWKCFTVDANGRRFGNRAWSGKRAIPQLVPDPRIVRMHERFNLAGKHVLEFGCFEGVHTAGLCQFAGRVTGVDSRIENVVKSIVRTAMFGHSPSIFVCNIEEPAEFDRLPKADFAHHVGVLYHLKDPVRHLLALGPLIDDGLMLDTHVATKETAFDQYEVNGRAYRYCGHTEGGKREVFSGMYDHAKWLMVEDIRELLAQVGFRHFELAEQRDERNGPRVLIFARRA